MTTSIQLNAFDILRPDEMARMHRLITELGMVYLPWVGFEQELAAIYEPLVSANRADYVDITRYKSLEEGQRVVEALQRWDESAIGKPVLTFYPAERKEEQTAKALVSYIKSDLDRDLPPHLQTKLAQAFRLIEVTPKIATASTKKKGWVRSIFGF